MRTYLDTRKRRAVVVALLLVAVTAIAVPSVAFGKQAGTCDGMQINNFSPKEGKPGKTVVTFYGNHLEGDNYLNVFFKANDSTGQVWVHHSDMDLTHLGQGWFTAKVPDTALTGPVKVRDGSGCDFGFSKPFRTIGPKG